MTLRHLLLAALALAFLIPSASAQDRTAAEGLTASETVLDAPTRFTYSGVLTDAEGAALADGPRALVFRGYASAEDARAGAAPTWEESHNAAVVGGRFLTVLGSQDDVPPDVAENKRYKAADGDFSVAGVAARVKEDFGSIDIIVHSLANGPEVTKPLLETSRAGYLAAVSASSYSMVSLMQHFGPLMNPGGAAVSLTYIASERVIPGYGGGMSSAKAALESDTRVLSYEAGRKWGVRVNTISAGPLGSRAAKAIGFIGDMINYSLENAPLKEKELAAQEVGNVAAFLCSPLSSAVTGVTLHVDNGLSQMGLATDSKTLDNFDA